MRRKIMGKRSRGILAGLLASIMVLSCTACGNNTIMEDSSVSAGTEVSQQKADENSEQELLKVDFFASLSNYQGTQEGWYGKMLKEKFNIEFNIISPNVSGGGDTLYQTRTAAGNLGDLICISRDKLADCVKAGLIKDITAYVKDADELKQYDAGIKNLSAYLGDESKIYGIPTKMSIDEPLTPALDGLNPNIGCFIRWDYYEEIGAPEVHNLDEMLDVLKQIQELHPESDSGKKTYGISLFKDWDGSTLKCVAEVVSMYGWQGAGSEGIGTSNYFVSTDGTQKELVTQDDGTYYNILKFYNKANQMGLLDPDSTSQNWDTLSSKMKDGQILWSWNAWNSADTYNSEERKEQGIGYAYLPVTDQKLLAGGYSVYGNDGYAFAIGSGVSDENCKRLVEFLNWYASPESREYLDAGIKGLCWTDENQEPCLTDYGKTATIENSPVPEEYGGGNYYDGGCQFNNSRINANIVNPNYNVPYIPSVWPTTIADNRTKLDENWSAVVGYDNPSAFFEENPDKIAVFPGTNWIPSTPSTDIQTAQAQINTLVTSTSWKMILRNQRKNLILYGTI